MLFYMESEFEAMEFCTAKIIKTRGVLKIDRHPETGRHHLDRIVRSWDARSKSSGSGWGCGVSFDFPNAFLKKEQNKAHVSIMVGHGHSHACFIVTDLPPPPCPACS